MDRPCPRTCVRCGRRVLIVLLLLCAECLLLLSDHRPLCVCKLGPLRLHRATRGDGRGWGKGKTRGNATEERERRRRGDGAHAGGREEGRAAPEGATAIA